MAHLTHTGRALVVATLAMSSCDFFYGVNRRAPISAAPDFTCVARVIREAPGVEDLSYSRTQGGRPLTWTGVKPATDIHTFIYRDAQVFGAVQITIEYDGRTEFSQTLLDINRKPPQALIDASRPVMDWIEQRLESECGMTGLTGVIKESCPGVECPPLTHGAVQR